MRILKLIFKNALRHKLRTLLTVVGISIAVIAFGILRTVVTAWNAGVEASAANRLITRQAVSFIFPLPLAYRDQITKIPGVETVTYANWFQGVYIDKNQFFARLAVDPETIFEVYPEFVVSKDEYQTFLKERNSCIIGQDIVRLGPAIEPGHKLRGAIDGGQGLHQHAVGKGGGRDHADRDREPSREDGNLPQQRRGHLLDLGQPSHHRDRHGARGDPRVHAGVRRRRGEPFGVPRSRALPAHRCARHRWMGGTRGPDAERCGPGLLFLGRTGALRRPRRALQGPTGRLHPCHAARSSPRRWRRVGDHRVCRL